MVAGAKKEQTQEQRKSGNRRRSSNWQEQEEMRLVEEAAGAGLLSAGVGTVLYIAELWPDTIVVWPDTTVPYYGRTPRSDEGRRSAALEERKRQKWPSWDSQSN